MYNIWFNYWNRNIPYTNSVDTSYIGMKNGINRQQRN